MCQRYRCIGKSGLCLFRLLTDVYLRNLGGDHSFISKFLILCFSHQPNSMTPAKVFPISLTLSYVTLEVSKRAVLLTHSFILIGNSVLRLVFGL